MDKKQIYDYILQIQSIAKIGLTYSRDPYALTNYKQVNELSKKMLEEFMEVKIDRPNYFSKDVYPTPNVSCRTIIFNEDNSKVLFVREVNSGLYSLPGGWCDIYDSPSDTAKNEAKQEAGAIIKDLELVGITNEHPFSSETSIPNYLITFKAKIESISKEHEYETDDVDFFDINNLPPTSRKTKREEIIRLIDAALHNKVIFD